MRKTLICALALALSVCALSGCGDSVPGNLYEREDIVMQDTIYDMEALTAYQPKVERVAKNPMVPDGVESIMYTSVGYNRLKETRIFAYYGKPSGAKPAGGYPAVVLVHGGLGKAEYAWVQKWNERGYAAIAMDLFAHMDTESLMKTENPEGGPDESNVGSFLNMGLPDEWTWTYQRVASIIYANNILRADADVCASKIGLAGISWGAYLTCITAGLDKRFAFFAPIYGCGYLYEDQTWINAGCNSAYMGADEFEKWKAECDPSRYLPYATKPILFLGGVNRDEPFAADLRQRSADLCKGKVFYSYREALTHSQESGDSQIEVMDFADHVLYGKNTVLLLEENPDGAGFQVTGGPGAASVKLVYTTADTQTLTNAHLWSFSSVAVACANGQTSFTADLPEGCTAYFFEIRDNNQSKWSTKLHFVTEK